MTKGELKAKAKEMGLKVRENFMDDIFENLAILVSGVMLGWIAHAVYRIFS